MEVLSPNATVYVQGGRTSKDSVPAGSYRIDNQLLAQSSSCRLQQIRTFGCLCLFLHQLIVMWLPAGCSRLNNFGCPLVSYRTSEGENRLSWSHEIRPRYVCRPIRCEPDGRRKPPVAVTRGAMDTRGSQVVDPEGLVHGGGNTKKRCSVSLQATSVTRRRGPVLPLSEPNNQIHRMIAKGSGVPVLRVILVGGNITLCIVCSKISSIPYLGKNSILGH